MRAGCRGRAMAKSKSHEHRRNRQKVALAVAEINQSIEQLRERVTQVEDMKKDGFPYRDALKARAEVQIRDTIRRIFGDKSPEFQEHRHHHIKTYPVTEIGQTLSILQGLIARLEQKKLDYLGVSQDRPDTVPTPQPSDSIASPAQRPQAPPSPPPATVITGTPFVIYSTPPGTVWAPPPVTPPSPTTAAPASATASPAPPVADPVRPVSSPPPPPPIAAKPGAPLTVRSTKSSTTDRYTSPSVQQARSEHGLVGSDRQRPDWSYA